MRTPAAVLPQLVAIPGGEFLMGNDAGPDNERPAHLVLLPGFRAAVAPVTNAEYSAFVAATNADLPRFIDDPQFNAPGQPVVGVSWYEAVAYCEWLTRETGIRFVLPTEAMREFASLGGLSGVDWPWGDGAHPLASELTSLGRPHPPGERCANRYGLRCMAENVHEWCSDWYDATYYTSSPTDSPSGPDSGERKAARGGSWRHQIKFTRLTARAAIPPSFRYNDFGFRVYAEAQASTPRSGVKTDLAQFQIQRTKFAKKRRYTLQKNKRSRLSNVSFVTQAAVPCGRALNSDGWTGVDHVERSLGRAGRIS